MKTKSSFRKILFLLVIIGFFSAYGQPNSEASCEKLIHKAEEQTRNGNYTRSLEILFLVRASASKNKWYKQEFTSLNTIVKNYIAMMDYGEALKYCLQAYTLAMQELDPEYEINVLNNIAIIYTDDQNYEKAREYYQKAYKTAKENKYPGIGIYLINLGNIENILNNPASSRAFIKEAMPSVRKYQPKSVVVAEMIDAESILLLGNATQARFKAQQLLLQKNAVTYNEIEEPIYEIIAKCYIAENNLQKAKNIVDSQLALKPNLEIKRRLFELQSDIYLKAAKASLSVQYRDSIIQAERELNQIKNGRVFENNKVKFEVQDYKNQIAINEEKLSSERKIFNSIIAIITTLIIIILLIVRQKKLIVDKRFAQEKNDKLLLEKRINEKEAAALLEQERLKNEIEVRNRELSAKALYLSGRNQLIEEILSSLTRKIKLTKDPTILDQIETLKRQLKNDNEWDNFIMHFEEVNPGFINRLKTLHPMLTLNDVRFITYLYMNLSIKEIASMFNITAESCRKRKERIAQKMEIPENTNIFNYISTI